ncbi:unannotated protein [freshwater metagenome]|uniref:Unannotated protein n=1 Tax=freshwater metagenome TaxID=449393 RepID=A0A6J6YCG3_9ZZZZ
MLIDERLMSNGLPSAPSANPLFMLGTASAMARTMANAMTWVKLTLPRPTRERYELMP